MSARVVVDQVLCEGHGLCEAVAPAVFELDADERAHVRDIEITDDLLPSVREAVQVCPCQAIQLHLDG